MNRKLLIVNVAALGWDLLETGGATSLGELTFAPVNGVFPGLTCCAQASFRTSLQPAGHGMIANGIFDRRLKKAMFWEQSAGLLDGPRFWNSVRKAGKTVGMLFWQQSLGETVDITLSPAPIHKHHGGMIMDCYAQPAGLYAKLCEKIGRPFSLKHYWGPLAKAAVGDWIAEATRIVMSEPNLSPDLLLTYLPSLDYDLQRHGPESPQAAAALKTTLGQMQTLAAATTQNGYDILIFGDYAIAPCNGPAVFPNRLLAEAGLLKTRNVRGMLYPDLYRSAAFAMVDHEIAHVYVPDPANLSAVADGLRSADGIAEVLDAAAMRDRHLDHPNSGELLLLAEEGRWLAYPWWAEPKQAPDYASHIDIHNKPGYDPCELFGRLFPPGVSQDTTKIRGTHGRARRVAYAASFELPSPPESLIDLSRAAMQHMEGAAS